MSRWKTLARARTRGVCKDAQIIQSRNYGGFIQGRVHVGSWQLLGRVTPHLFWLLADNLRTHQERLFNPTYDHIDAERVMKFIRNKPVKIRISARENAEQSLMVWDAEILEVMG